MRPFSGNKEDFIIGLNGCHCHPFSSWEECKKFHNQKFNIGDFVEHRHMDAQGTIYKNSVEGDTSYVIVKFGPLPKDRHQQHVAELKLIKKKQD